MSKRFIPLGFAISCCLSSAALAEDLLDTYRLAQQSDPQLAAAAANFEAAREEKSLSRAGLLPSINLSASAARSIDDTTYLNPLFNKKIGYNNYGYQLALTQPLFRAERFTALALTDLRIAKARSEYEAAKQALLLRVARAYFEVLAAQDNLHFARAEQVAVARQLEQTKQRFEVGLTAITDVNEAQARHDLIGAQVIAAEFALDDKRETLRQITGQYPDQPVPLAQDLRLPPPEPADMDAWNKAALEQNLKLQAARYAAKLAEKAVQQSRNGHLPTLDLTLSHSKSSGGSFVDESVSNRVGVQFNLPIYGGGGTSAAVRQARSQYQAARHNLEQQRRATEAGTRTAYRSVTASIVRVQALKQAVISNQSALDATEAGYEVGTRTSVDVLNARRELFRAQRDYAQARYDYIISSLTLKDAAGMLSQNDLQQINQWLEDSAPGQP